jgi:hypothetical protein
MVSELDMCLALPLVITCIHHLEDPHALLPLENTKGCLAYLDFEKPSSKVEKWALLLDTLGLFGKHKDGV